MKTIQSTQKVDLLTAFFEESERRYASQNPHTVLCLPPAPVFHPSNWEAFNEFSIALAWPKCRSLIHTPQGFMSNILSPRAWITFKNTQDSLRWWNITIICKGSLFYDAPIASMETKQCIEPLAGLGTYIHNIDTYTFPSFIKCVALE